VTPEEENIDLVVFELAGIRYGADLSQVIRLDFFDEKSSVGQPLGAPSVGAKALMIDAGDGREWCLAIDTLHGVRSVPVEQLRRLPQVARGGAISIGAWLDGEQAVLLVDLKAMTGA
jgi:chemotaxis signal transduction protein